MEKRNIKKSIFFNTINKKLIFLSAAVIVVIVLSGILAIFALSNTSAEDLSTRSKGIMLIFMFFSIFLVFGFTYFIYWTIAKPLRELTEATEKFKEGDIYARSDVLTRDEIGRLAHSFNRSAEAISRLDEEHKQIDKTKTEFLSITSHELRSPITTMKAQLQMLQQNYFGKLTRKQRESTEMVLRNTERLDKIILDLLEISRIESARLKLRFAKVNIKKYINNLVKEMNIYLPEKNIKIKADIRVSEIECDPDRLVQVLRNLIENAKKFSPAKSTLVVSAVSKRNEIEFSVKDEGMGISREDQDYLFEPFFQAERAMNRSHGGTGLGLALCKGIVESQGGKIWAKSKLKEGSTFYFILPKKPVKKAKPINLLFSKQQEINKKVLFVFRKYLGEIGITEFYNMSKKGVNYENTVNSVGLMKGRLESDEYAEMKKEIKEIFGILKSQKEDDIETKIKERKIIINYNVLIRKLIAKAYSLYGDVAIRKANSIDGLTVNELGEISIISGKKEEILRKLEEKYGNMMGDLRKFVKEQELKLLLRRN